MMSCCVIIPTFGHFDYALAAARSALADPLTAVLVVDDASPDWASSPFPGYRGLGTERLFVHRFPQNGGLTRSWNFGLRWAKAAGCEFACCTNSDVLFPLGWDKALRVGIHAGWGLLGPVSNAPGVTSRGLQEVWRYCPDYHVSDEPRKISKTLETLYNRHHGEVVESPINGFCLFASVEGWFRHAFDPENCFNPDKKHRMTLNEDELQGRWRRAGAKVGIALDSFVFHYRSVSRGDRFRRDRWYRKRK